MCLESSSWGGSFTAPTLPAVKVFAFPAARVVVVVVVRGIGAEKAPEQEEEEEDDEGAGDEGFVDSRRRRQKVGEGWTDEGSQLRGSVWSV